MPSPCIAVTYVSANQNQKEVTINAGFDALDGAANRILDVDCSLGDPVVVGAADYTRNQVFRLAGVPDHDFEVTFPDTERSLTVLNDSGRTATLSSEAGGTTTNLPSGYKGIFVNIGEDLLPIAIAAGSGGGGDLAGLADVSVLDPADGDQLTYASDVGLWKNGRRPYVVGSGALTGTLTGGQVLLYHRFSKAVTIPEDFAGFLGHATQVGGDVEAAADAAVEVARALAATPTSFVDVGTITVGAGTADMAGADTLGSPIEFARGDVLRLRGPSPADATLSNFYATIVGFEA